MANPVERTEQNKTTQSFAVVLNSTNYYVIQKTPKDKGNIYKVLS